MRLPPWDPEIIELAQQGDERAWNILCTTFGPTVLSWCTFLSSDGVDPEDSAQKVFLTVWRRLHTLKDPTSFPSWLYGIVRRVLANQRRSAWLRRWLPDVNMERMSKGPDPESLAARSEVARQVEGVLAQLSSKLREIIVLCDLEGHTTVEAAELLDIAPNTAKSRLNRARKRFGRVARERGLGGQDMARALPGEGA